jgi:phosphoenolpyruvate synthase/pyruvate phosphate dikinase
LFFWFLCSSPPHSLNTCSSIEDLVCGDPACVEFPAAGGIDSISVSPDSFMAVKQHVAQAEAQQRSAKAG